MIGRKTDMFIPLSKFAKIKKAPTLEQLVEKSANIYQLEKETVFAQLKKLIPKCDKNILKRISDVYNQDFESLTTPAKIILANICAEYAQKKLNWLRDKQSQSHQRVKRVEALVKHALERERASAILCFLHPQKRFLDKYELEDDIEEKFKLCK